MPWDHTRLCVGDIAADGSVSNVHTLAGGAASESVMQPRWAPDGALFFISDRSGWWNLYSVDAAAAAAEARPLCPREAEFGGEGRTAHAPVCWLGWVVCTRMPVTVAAAAASARAGPMWKLGQQDYAVLPDGHLLCVCSAPEAPGDVLGVVTASGTFTPISAPFTTFGAVAASLVAGGALQIACIGGSPQRPTCVAVLDVPAGATIGAAGGPACSPMCIPYRLVGRA